MGLRFRKSITLCKGVRLNIGKTGVSLSAGVPGFRKTIHSSGRVTTSVGIPGTGIYYVDTKNPKKEPTSARPKQQNQTPMYARQPTPIVPSIPAAQPHNIPRSDTAPNCTNFLEAQGKSVYIPPVTNVTAAKEPVTTTPAERIPASKPVTASVEAPLPIPDVIVPSVLVTNLFKYCDYPVKWIDVLTNEKPPEDVYNLEVWEYLRSKAIDVFEGNIEAMLEVVEHINPYDDLLDYLFDFEFEADDANCLEITCAIHQGSLGKEKEDAIASLIIRLARDTFALLPIYAVRIHILNTQHTQFNDVYFKRERFVDTMFDDYNAKSLLNNLSQSL